MAIEIIVWVVFNGIGFVLLNKAMTIRRKAKSAAHWPSTPGKVLESSVEEDTNRSATGKVETSFVPLVVYEYNVDGKTFKGERIIFGRPNFDFITACNIRDKFAVDSQMPVYYNPDNPLEAVLAPKSTAGMLSRVPGVFFILIGIVVALFSIFKS
ncbi:MAG: hypothetical protein FD147_1029 [Chloroflexi bacterium]|nr:MAG: hypothetical protein FD147_1029 [Chloroflexota bacterium]MBA4374882.1 hypothetical protein [Anaerolinea sp.]